MGIAVNKGWKLPKGSRVHKKGTDQIKIPCFLGYVFIVAVQYKLIQWQGAIMKIFTSIRNLFQQRKIVQDSGHNLTCQGQKKFIF